MSDTETVQESEVQAEQFDFGRALEVLKSGGSVARTAWNAHHTLTLQTPDENSKMTRPYIYMTVGSDAADMQGATLPWVCSQTDMLATDWHIA